VKHRSTLREIERKIWLRMFEHGLWDIALGSVFLSFGLSILISFPPLTAIWVAALYPSLRDAGRRLVIPRIGHVKFKARRQRANARLIGILSVSVVVGLMAFLFTAWASEGGAPGWALWIRGHFAGVLGTMWGAMIVVTGWLVDFPRLYVYGALMVVALWTTDLAAGIHLGVSLTGVGSIILCAGLILLVRFLRTYPKQNDPDGAANA